jgi:hypothetical protein
MTDYDIAGHTVSIEFDALDLGRFWQAARAAEGGSACKTQAGLHAVLPKLCERLTAQLPTTAKDRP